MGQYFFSLFVSLSQFANTILAGDPDETISSRAGKAKREGRVWGCLLCRFLDLFDRKHCEKSIEEDEGK
ncbi:hypothetical protein [Sneathiella sp.]|uniref:hypothetical protein n=1 Tax=Sneathiella sp. TaxID=1964365 RepID=UPI002FE3D34E